MKIKSSNVSLWLLLLVILCFASVRSFAQTVNLKFYQTPVKSILKEITKQTGYNFIYSDALKEVNKEIDFNYTSNTVDIKDLLEKLFATSSISYKIENKQIMMAPKNLESDTSKVQGEDISISGTILDNNKVPLVGVTIKNENSGIYSFSDANGNYSIKAKQGDILTYSLLGMKTVKQNVGKSSLLDISMESENIILDNVIVTGYQTIEKGRATGSFVVVNQKAMDNIYSTNINDKLEGIASGLYTDKDNNIVIRGINTINGNNKPLFVVDGFPIENYDNNLNPNDIEQISILKDAASASIWGIRAANGVVVITTKKGRSTQQTKVNYSGTITTSGSVDWDDLHILSSDQYAQIKFQKLLGKEQDYALSRGLNDFEKIYQLYNNKTITLDQAWEKVREVGKFNNAKQLQDNFYRRAFTQQHNVSVLSGGEKVSVFASLNYDQDISNLVGNEAHKANILINNDIKLCKRLNLGIGIRGSYRKSKNNGENVSDFEPWRRILNDDGSYYNEPNGISELWLEKCYELGMKDWHKNTLENMRMNDKENVSYNIATSLKLSWKPIEQLELSSQASYDIYNSETNNFYSENHYFTRNLVNTYTSVELTDDLPSAITAHHIPISGGIKDIFEDNTASYSVRNSISFSDTYGNFNVKAIIGNEIYSRTGTLKSNRFWGFSDELLTSQNVNLKELQNGVIGYNGKEVTYDYAPEYSETLERYLSYFGTASTSYKNTYDLFLSLRLDQTNLLTNASKFRNSPSWSVGAKWNISKEKFFSSKWIDDLSMRASYGLAGNINKSTAPDMVATAHTDFTIGNLNCLSVSNPANPNLGWEKTLSFNYGIDYSLFNSRLSGNIDYYLKTSKELLANIEIDPTNGWERASRNSAELKNYGIDFSLNAGIISKSKFKWNAVLNLSYNNNRVTKIFYTPSLRSVTSNSHSAYTCSPIKNQPMGYIAVHKYGGLDEEGEPTFMKKGDDTKYSYTDYNKMTMDDINFVGRMTPPVFGSIVNDFTYGNLTLGFMVSFKLGHKLILPSPYPSSFGLYTEWFDEKYRWVEGADNTGKFVPKFYAESEYAPTGRNDCFLASDKMVDNANVIYLRSISLSYNITSLLNKIKIEGGNLKLSCENLYYWAANKYNLDPDQLTTSVNMFEYSTTFKKKPKIVLSMNINF